MGVNKNVSAKCIHLQSGLPAETNCDRPLRIADRCTYGSRCISLRSLDLRLPNFTYLNGANKLMPIA